MKIQIPPNVNKILNVLNINGYEGYIVGGCVRDSILNRIPNDWDICTNCRPEKMLEIFISFKVIPTGLKHGTVTLVIDKENYEVTTYRIDGDYIDGRHPEEVKFTNSLKEDLKRRDFTINAMAYSDKEGLIDCYGGTSDILNRKVRCVGDPLKRFSEDYLRMLRGVRFSTQLGYSLDDDTFEAIKNLSKNIAGISAERIREELNRILLTHKPSDGIILLSTTNLLRYIIPELEICVGFEIHNPNYNKSLFNHILDRLDNTENDLILRLSALFHDIGKPEIFSLDEEGIGHFYSHDVKGSYIAKSIMKRLKYDNISIEKVLVLVKEHMPIYIDLDDKSIKALINRVGIDNINKLFKLQIADIKARTKREDMNNVLKLKSRVERILNEKQPLSVKDLKITGSDLIKLGVPQGKQIGIILNELMEIILETPELNIKENLVEIVQDKLTNLSRL